MRPDGQARGGGNIVQKKKKRGGDRRKTKTEDTFERGDPYGVGRGATSPERTSGFQGGRGGIVQLGGGGDGGDGKVL